MHDKSGSGAALSLLGGPGALCLMAVLKFMRKTSVDCVDSQKGARSCTKSQPNHNRVTTVSQPGAAAARNA